MPDRANKREAGGEQERIVKEILSNGTVVLMTRKEERAWRKSHKTSVDDKRLTQDREPGGR
jgi:hypothetical protein